MAAAQQAGYQQAMAEQQAAQQAAPPPKSMDEKVAEIQKLSELNKQGILTDEEFQAQKTKILNS